MEVENMKEKLYHGIYDSHYQIKKKLAVNINVL